MKTTAVGASSVLNCSDGDYKIVMLLSQQRRLCNPGALIELLLHACSTQGNAAAYLSPLLGWLGLYQLLGSSYPSEGGWPAPRSHCLKNGVCTSIFAPTHCQLYKPTGPCDVHYFLPLGWLGLYQLLGYTYPTDGGGPALRPLCLGQRRCPCNIGVAHGVSCSKRDTMGAPRRALLIARARDKPLSLRGCIGSMCSFP